VFRTANASKSISKNTSAFALSCRTAFRAVRYPQTEESVKQLIFSGYSEGQFSKKSTVGWPLSNSCWLEFPVVQLGDSRENADRMEEAVHCRLMRMTDDLGKSF